MDDALLIGDSRTVGLAEQGEREGADFFASVGLTAHRALETELSVPRVGKLTLEELLEAKSYGKIYIMLGINELEYPPEETVGCMEQLLRRIRTLQPRAKLIVLGNLHVTAQRSESDPCYNNPAIDRLNEALARLAGEQDLAYLDPNVLTDDSTGALDRSKSADNAHLLAQEYRAWGVWLREQTLPLLEGKQS